VGTLRPALIRVGLPGDSRAIARLIVLAAHGAALDSFYDRCFPGSQATRTREIEHLVRSPVRSWFHWSVFWVAEMDGRVVGALAACEASVVARGAHRLALEQACPAHPAETWVIGHLAVCREARRRGLGRELLNRALSEGAEAGFSEVAVDLRSGNVAAARLLERAGFVAAEPFTPALDRDRAATRMHYRYPDGAGDQAGRGPASTSGGEVSDADGTDVDSRVRSHGVSTMRR
jgi:ribosomal protein S18 acetylase RimI-like enzyme